MEDSSTIDGDEMLVLLVERHAILYDKSLADYKDNNKKRDAWNEIASDMFHLTQTSAEVKDLVNKWKGLKRKFMDERRKVTAYIPSGSSASISKTQWKHYEAMRFMEKHVQHRRTVSNFANAANADCISDEDDDEEDEEAYEVMACEEFDDSQEDGHSSEQLDGPTLTDAKKRARVKNYLLVFRDAWRRIPEKNRTECFFELQKVIGKAMNTRK